MVKDSVFLVNTIRVTSLRLNRSPTLSKEKKLSIMHCYRANLVGGNAIRLAYIVGLFELLQGMGNLSVITMVTLQRGRMHLSLIYIVV